MSAGRTLKRWMIDQLTANGMWPNDAKTVFEVISNHDTNESMIERWDEDCEGYPIQLRSILWFGAKQIALEWIEENQPNVFYKSMFEV